jgi:predicted nucleic acid-binding protein
MVASYNIDSSVWVSYFYEQDSNHKEALKLKDIIEKSGLIPDFIFQETATVLRIKIGVEVSNKFVELFSDQEDFKILSFLNFNETFQLSFYLKKIINYPMWMLHFWHYTKQVNTKL